MARSVPLFGVWSRLVTLKNGGLSSRVVAAGSGCYIPRMALDERAFETLTETLLRRWAAAIEDSGADDLDVELQGGILTLEGKAGTFVLSRHNPLRQLWLSSPLSGASHYARDDATGAWRSTRGGADLAATLGGELKRAAGADVVLDYAP
ncbi:MAG TPA: iron donor protein CyaY [Candidatus Cybelea sp.]|nr:iron donor protein CyaY [Candidatus Cybelea sp.]